MNAIGYARVSTQEQSEHGVSLGDQEHRIREYAAEQGWECEAIYTDRGVSGSIPFASRPAGAQALASDAEVIVVVAWDRLSRDMLDFLTTLRDREVVSISEGDEPEMMRNIRAVFAQEERKKIRERTKAAAAAIHRQGRYNGPPPMGYRFEDGALQVVDAEVPIVKRIFAEFIAGRTYTDIVRALNADRIQTRRGGRWRIGTVRPLLANPLYVGRVRMAGEEREGNHEGIVDPAVYAKARELAAARAITEPKGGRPPASRHLFRGGILRCGLCGEAVVPRTPTKGRDHYKCSGRQITGCELRIAYREDIDTAVYSYFEQVGLDVEATRDALTQARDRKLAEVRALLSQAEGEAHRAGERLSRVRRDYTEGALDAADWREFRDELEIERQGAEAEVGHLRAQLVDTETWAGLRDAEVDTLAHLTEIRRALIGEVRSAEGLDAVRSALSRTFEHFILHPAGAGPAVLHPELAFVPGFVVEPVVREQALQGYTESMLPVLRREPLEAEENNRRKGVGYRLLPS